MSDSSADANNILTTYHMKRPDKFETLQKDKSEPREEHARACGRVGRLELVEGTVASPRALA